MNKSLLSKCALTSVLLGSAALAAPTWRAWSDQTELPPLAEHRAQVAKMAGDACRATAHDSATPGLAIAGGRNLDEIIKSFEEALARMKPSDAGYESMRQSLEQFRELRKRDTPPLPVGRASGAMTLGTAVANAEKFLGTNARQVPPAAGGADVAAALAAGNPKAALGMLLASHRANPKSAWTLVNLAGALSLVGLPREAIAVLDVADELGGPLPSPSGVPGRAIALSNRGYAFLGLGRWKEAQEPLRAALKLAPDFSEARANLSQALLCSGDVDGAVRELRVAMRRTPEGQASEDFSVKESQPNRHGSGVEAKDRAPTRRPARDLFDLSLGVEYNLPPLKYPRNRVEASVLYDQYVALERAGSVEVNALIDRTVDTRIKAKLDAGEKRWARLVSDASAKATFEPSVWPAYKAAYDAHYALWDAIPRFSKAFNEAMERPLAGTGCAAYKARADEAYGAYLDGLQPFLRGQQQAMARYVSVVSKHRSALAANLTDPHSRSASLTFIEAEAKGIFYGLVVGSAQQIASPARYLRFECDDPTEKAVTLGDVELPELTGDVCGGVPTGVKLKSKVPSNLVKIDGYGLSFGLSCQKLDIELSASAGIGLFAAANLDWKGTSTVFFGIKADVKAPPLGGTVKVGAGVKESLYVKFGKDGILDAGLRIEGKGSAVIGPDVGVLSWDGKFEQEFGVAAAVAYWMER